MEGNEPSSLSNRFERPSETLRLQYWVQVMLTHYMFGLLSLLKCSKRKRGECTDKLEAEHKSRGGMEKKKRLREKEYDNTIRQISVICLQRVWGDITVGLTVWRGCSTRKAMHVMERHFQRAHTLHELSKTYGMRSGLGRVLSASAWPEPSCLGLRSSLFDGGLVISPTGDINEKIFLAR